MAKIDVSNQSSASVPTPSAGNTSVYVDTADKKLKTKDDTGTVTDYSAPGSSITALTGEVTATGPGSVAATVSNAAVISKVLTGYVASPGVVAATDTILQAIQKLGARIEAGWFGDGHDGDVTISADTTLVRDMYYNNLTVNSGATLFTGGFRIHVLGTCTVASGGAIDRNGNNASGNTAGAASAAGTLTATIAGGTGGGAGVGAGGSASGNAVGAAGGAGGAGGTGGTAAGAAGTLTVVPTNSGGTDVLFTVGRASLARDTVAAVCTGGSGGGGGGGSGAATSGGGGGAGGGVLLIAAKTLTGAGTIRANGGIGGNAPIANGGGGGGGGGGAVVFITDNDTTATSLVIQVNGGLGGGGAGNGVTGSAGSVGRIYRVRT